MDESTNAQDARAEYDESPIFARDPGRLSIVVFDDFYRDPDAVRAHALRLSYVEDPDSEFPGMRSWQPTPIDMIDLFERATGKRPGRVVANFQYQREIDGAESFIHSDQSDWAAVVYLSPDAGGRPGTSLYRHKEMSLSRLPDAFDHVRLSRQLGMEPNAVITKLREDRFELDRWELLLTVPARYNRLVVYDASHFHRNASAWGTTLEDSRLVQSFFAATGELLRPEEGLPIRVADTAFGSELPGAHAPELP